MRNTLFVLKGFVSLIILRVIILVSILIVQSCTKVSKTDFQNEKQALQNFKKKMDENKFIISTIYNKYISINQSNKKQKLVLPNQVGIQNISEPIIMESNIIVSNDDIASMTPLLQSSKELLAAYNLLDAMKQQFNNEDNDPRYIQAAMVVYSVEQHIDNSNNDIVALSSFIVGTNTVYAKKALDCVLQAVGVADLGVLLRMGIKQAIIDLGVTGVAEMIGGFLIKHIGWWGAVAAVYVFTSCMNE
ncbi:MAG: hypothetical protein JST07_07305 [Bacteroidetes bacterium]|nr:hypothetical protein [Bacteroidota bacterium]